MFGLHFVPDGVDGLYTGKDTVFQSHFVQLRPYRSGELIEYLVALHGGGFQFLFLSRGYSSGCSYLKLRFSSSVLIFVQAEAVWRAGHKYRVFSPAILNCFVGQHGAECTHVYADGRLS